MIRLLAPRDYRVMPWKNGGGTTTEIFIFPEGAGWDTIQWRVGIADIRQSGPFSSFPGIARSIMLLDCPAGSGMRLTIDGREIDLPLHRFVDFAGEATTTGTLLGEPVRDFNVMSRRERVRHRCGFQDLAAGLPSTIAGDEWTFAHVVAGDAVYSSDAGAQRLAAGHSLVAGDHAALQIKAGDSGCRLVWASFSPVSEVILSE